MEEFVGGDRSLEDWVDRVCEERVPFLLTRRWKVEMEFDERCLGFGFVEWLG